MPEWAELQRKTVQRDLLMASYKRLEERLRGPQLLRQRQSVSALLVPPGSPQAKQLQHLHGQLSLGQSCHRQKQCCIYASRIAAAMSYSLQSCRLWPARLLSQGWGFSRQEHWSELDNTYGHANLEYFISCCPGRQLP